MRRSVFNSYLHESIRIADQILAYPMQIRGEFVLYLAGLEREAQMDGNYALAEELKATSRYFKRNFCND